MWGLVLIDDDSIWFCGVTRGTNNTGEINGLGQALMWLRDVVEATNIPATMLFDYCYAANIVVGRWQPNAGPITEFSPSAAFAPLAFSLTGGGTSPTAEFSPLVAFIPRSQRY
jgi:hypothetical protein